MYLTSFSSYADINIIQLSFTAAENRDIPYFDWRSDRPVGLWACKLRRCELTLFVYCWISTYAFCVKRYFRLSSFQSKRNSSKMRYVPCLFILNATFRLSHQSHESAAAPLRQTSVYIFITTVIFLVLLPREDTRVSGLKQEFDVKGEICRWCLPARGDL